MIVLLDLEWIEKSQNHLTQLSALRVDERWNPISHLDILCRVPEDCCLEPEHLAFGGYPVDRFRNAVTEEDAVLTFAEWLSEDDVIWVWAKSNKKLLQHLWNFYNIPVPLPQIKHKASRAREALFGPSRTAASLYASLAYLGEDAPLPEHRSSNDVQAMRLLFSRLENADAATQAAATIEKPATPVVKLSIRVKNSVLVDRSLYNYNYAEGGAVFHRRSCRHCLGAKTLLGAIYYETAARGRRPCRICRPVPHLGLPKPVKQAPKKVDRPEEAVETKLLGGATEYLKPSSVIGWCQCARHPGAITVQIMKEHRCLKKNCRHFQKNEDALYWKKLLSDAKKKEQKKIEKKERKAKEKAEEDALQRLRETWQAHLDTLDSDMYIVRIAREEPSF